MQNIQCRKSACFVRQVETIMRRRIGVEEREKL
jgi:hypothetical protein